MFTRTEEGKLQYRRLDSEIFFDDIFDDARDENEIQWMFNQLFQTLYFEAIEMARDKGFEDFEPDVSL